MLFFLPPLSGGGGVVKTNLPQLVIDSNRA
jgi:hypothetical protein